MCPHTCIDCERTVVYENQVADRHMHVRIHNLTSTGDVRSCSEQETILQLFTIMTRRGSTVQAPRSPKLTSKPADYLSVDREDSCQEVVICKMNDITLDDYPSAG